MNAGAWIGIIGGILGLVVGIGAVLTTAGSSGIYIAGGMLVVFGGMFFLFYKLFFGPMIMSSRLQKTGISGKALIREVHDTGVTINNNPQVKLVIDVKNYLGQTYSTTMRVLVSRLQPNMYQTGMTIPVKIDPKNENNVVVDGSGDMQTGQTKSKIFPQTSGVGVEGLNQQLMQDQQANEVIRLTGRAARAIVRSYTWLGMNINGNNPYVELEVEVLPDGGLAFTARVKGAVMESAVAKYQPGQEIFVRYDPADTTKVTIDYS